MPQGWFPSGAGGRTRTGTPSLAVDFESTTSTNSITPAVSKDIIHEKMLFDKRRRQKFLTGFIHGIFIQKRVKFAFLRTG